MYTECQQTLSILQPIVTEGASVFGERERDFGADRKTELDQSVICNLFVLFFCLAKPVLSRTDACCEDFGSVFI